MNFAALPFSLALLGIGRQVLSSSEVRSGARRHLAIVGVAACAAAVSLLQAAVLSAVLARSLSASEPANDWFRQMEIANALVESGQLDEAGKAYEQALAEAERTGDPIRVGLVLQNEGRLLDRKGRLREAENAYLRAIQVLTRAGVADDELLLRSYEGLPALYVQTGQHSKAEALIRRVLADYPAGAESDKASLMGTLGVILIHKHRLAEAENVLRETVLICAGRSSPEMQEVGAIALANLAGLHMRAARTSDAIDSYQRALMIMESLPTPSPATLAITLAGYAKAVRGTGDNQASETLYRRAIALAESRLGQSHVILADLLQRYAELVRDSGRTSEARKLVDAARRIQTEWNRENMIGHTVEIESLDLRK